MSTPQNMSMLTVTGMTGRITVNSYINALFASARQNYNQESGFSLEQDTSTSLTYPIVKVVDNDADEDAPALVLTMSYEQPEAYEEVDLNLSWEGIPTMSEVEVAITTDYADFNISRQQLNSTSGKTGKISVKGTPIDTTLTLRLWCRDPAALAAVSLLSVYTTTLLVEEGDATVEHERTPGDGPVKMRLLGKTVVHLSPQ